MKINKISYQTELALPNGQTETYRVEAILEKSDNHKVALARLKDETKKAIEFSQAVPQYMTCVNTMLESKDDQQVKNAELRIEELQKRFSTQSFYDYRHMEIAHGRKGIIGRIKNLFS